MKQWFIPLLLWATIPATGLCAPLPAPPDCTHAGNALSAYPQNEIQDKLYRYMQQAESALSLRAKAIQLYHELLSRRKTGQPLSGNELLRLNEGAATLLSEREVLLKQAFAYECWSHMPLASDPDTARTQKTGVLISLSAALLLYDNYLSAISLYYHDPTLRYHLNRSDSGFAINRGELNNMAVAFADPAKRARVRKAIQWYERYAQKGASSDELEGYDYLRLSIEQSPSYRELKRKQTLKTVKSQFNIFSDVSREALLSAKDEGTHLFSALFGNTVGLVESRRGKLDRRPEVEEQVGLALRAGDILIEKTPFRLTDSFIPGYWGHAAIWIGTETELQALGLWDDPLIQRYHTRIRAGYGVVEALRSGVELNPLGRFLNVDDLSVLRQEGLSDVQRRQVILDTVRQIGKPYDFNFDAETTHRIFCSKLVYLAYGDLPWPTSRVMGRYSVSPDNIAALVKPEGPLKPVIVFHDGQQITDTAYEFLSNPERYSKTMLTAIQAASADQPASPLPTPP